MKKIFTPIAFFGAQIAAVLLLLSFSQIALGQVTYFNYTGANQSYVVPTGYSCITVHMWGAGGAGGGGNQYGGPGGGGAYVTGRLAVTAGETLTLVVGEGGNVSPNHTVVAYGGGGKGSSSVDALGGGGGGRSAILRGVTEVVTAGGGGGGGQCTSTGRWGGAGGGGGAGSNPYEGLNGYEGGSGSDSYDNTGGKGGEGGQNAAAGIGGVGGNNGGQPVDDGSDGSGTRGGTPGTYNDQSGGGGGGGWWGGGGGSFTDGTDPYGSGGGGGSSYIANLTNATHTGAAVSAQTAGNPTHAYNGSAYGKGGNRGSGGGNPGSVGQNGRIVIVLPAAATVTTQPASASICAGANRTFTVAATGTSLTYRWQRGIAGVYTNITGPTTPNDGCTYSGYTGVTLTITNAPLSISGYTYRCVISSCAPNVTSAVATLTVNAAVTAGTVSGTSPVCIGATPTYTSNGTAGGTWTSLSPSVATVAAGTGVVTALTAGTADIRYTISTGCGSPVSAFQTITVHPLPSPVPANTGPYCEGETIQLNVSGGNTFSWSGVNSFSDVTQNPSISNATTLMSGTYDVTATDLNGCSATASTNVVVNETPIAVASNTGPYCEGLPVQLNSGGGTSYAWSGPNAYSDATQNPSIASATVAMTGTYTVTVTGAANCSATASTSITIIPAVTLSASATNVSCSGVSDGAIDLTVITGQSPYTFLWSNAATSQNLSGIPSGTYTVTVTDAGACGPVTQTVTVTEAPPVEATITSDKSIMCSGDSAQVCAPAGFASYLWNTGNTDRCIYTKLAGNYYVTVSDNNGCSAASNHLAVTVYPQPPVSISVNGDTLRAYNSVTYQWYLNGVEIPGASASEWIATQSGNYTVLISDTNGCTAVSVPLAVTVTGVTGINYAQVKVYPNPTSGELHIQFENTGQAILRVYDATGKLVFSSLLHKNDSTIPIAKLANGIYALQLTDEKNSLIAQSKFSIIR